MTSHIYLQGRIRVDSFFASKTNPDVHRVQRSPIIPRNQGLSFVEYRGWKKVRVSECLREDARMGECASVRAWECVGVCACWPERGRERDAKWCTISFPPKKLMNDTFDVGLTFKFFFHSTQEREEIFWSRCHRSISLSRTKIWSRCRQLKVISN